MLDSSISHLNILHLHRHRARVERVQGQKRQKMLLTSVASFPFDAILTTMMAVGRRSDYLLHALHLR